MRASEYPPFGLSSPDGHSSAELTLEVTPLSNGQHLEIVVDDTDNAAAFTIGVEEALALAGWLIAWASRDRR